LWLDDLGSWAGFFASEHVTPVVSGCFHGCVARGACGNFDRLRSLLSGSHDQRTAVDVMRLIDSIRGRALSPYDALDPQDVVWRTLALDPDYVAPSLDANDRAEFRDVVGHLAVHLQRRPRSGGIAGEQAAWSQQCEQVLVEGELDLWDLLGEVCEPEGHECYRREYIPLWLRPDDADSILSERWLDLANFPIAAIELAWRLATPPEDRDTFPLRKYKLGLNFVPSVRAMGYTNRAGRLRTLYHTIAMIASSRAASLNRLEAHPHLRGRGDRPELRGGLPLRRGTLTASANAHRIFWTEGPVRTFIGVAGHDDSPPWPNGRPRLEPKSTGAAAN
jgi:hypothetical protein